MHLQPLQVLKKTVIAAAAMLAFAPAQADTNVYSFGSQISGQYSTSFQPAGTFATLAVTTADSMHYVFDLQTSANFGALFGNPNSAIYRVVFNTDNVDPIAGSVKLASGNTWGVDSVMYFPNDVELGGLTFDFTEGWTNPTNRFNSGERVVWESTFSSPTSFSAPPFALKVVGIGSSDIDQAWYIPTAVTAVPEPQTYGMLLAGLGILGFASRRRKIKMERVGA